MIKYKILIDGVDYTSSCSLPFKEQYVLDSALDNGVLNLFMIPRKEVFKPFTPITITKDSDIYNMFVASDKVTEIVGSGFYNHDLVLIEETKLLEKKVVDTNTTTQPLIHDYEAVNGSVYVTSIYNSSLISTTYNYYNDEVKAIMRLDTAELPSADTIFSKDTTHTNDYNFIIGYTNVQVTIILKDANNNTIDSFYGTGNVALNTPLTITNNLTNQIYSVIYQVSAPDGTSSLQNKFEFWGFSQEQIRAKKSITVLDKIDKKLSKSQLYWVLLYTWQNAVT